MNVLNRSISFAVCVALLDASADAQTPTSAIRTVAIAGDTAPGTQRGTVFRDFGNAALNDEGHVAFRGRMAGPGTSENRSWGAWSEGGGTLHLLAQVSRLAPGGGIFSDNIVTPQLDNLGRSFFWADVAGGTLYSEQNGTVTRVAGPGMQAAGAAPGVTYRPIWAGDPTFSINDLGQYVFATTLSGPGVVDGNRHGLWLGTGTSHQLLVRAGDPAPGTEAGTFFITSRSDFFAHTPTLNPSGVVAFAGMVNGQNVPSTGRQGVWVGSPGNLSLAIRSGTQTPGGAAGSHINDFSIPAINDAGDVAIIAGISGSGANNDRGIYALRDGALTKVVREGDPAPGGGVYTTVASLLLNGNGDIAFYGTFGAGDGMWKERNRVIEPVSLPSDQAPGGAVGERLTSIDEPVFNDYGQVAFMAGTSMGRTGIWAEDLGGVLRKIIVEGDVIEYRPGLLGTVTEVGSDALLGFAGSHDGRASGFNAAGQIAFRAEVDGRPGIFVSSLVLVPEPASFLMGAIAVMLGLLAHRFKRFPC